MRDGEMFSPARRSCLGITKLCEILDHEFMEFKDY